jgi:cytochrome P450
MEACRRRYGPIFSLRLGPRANVVMVADPEAAKKVLTANSETFRTGDTNGIFKDVVGPKSILLLDGPEHLHHRRILLPTVGHHVHRYSGLIAEIARRRMLTWRVGEELRLQQEMEAITFETIMRLTFGGDGTSDREAQLRDLLPEMMDKCDSPFTLIPWFHRELGGRSPFGQLVRIVEEIDEVLFAAIDARMGLRADEDADDTLSLLLRARYEGGSPLERETIRDELLTMMMAGYETTTNGLAWAFERLLRNPDKLARVLLELSKGDDAYLDAVVKETLRSRPVVPLTARKALVPIDLLGHRLPAGTVVMVGIYLIHSDPELFPDPDQFLPERFLGDDTAQDAAWMPFGGGVRRCLGASLAQLEMKVVLKTVLLNATLRAPDGADEPIARRRFTFAPGDEARAMVTELAEGFQAPRPSRFPARTV